MKMRQFLVFPNPEVAGLAPAWAAGGVRDGKDEQMVPTEAIGYKLAGDSEVKMEILAKKHISGKPTTRPIDRLRQKRQSKVLR